MLARQARNDQRDPDATWDPSLDTEGAVASLLRAPPPARPPRRAGGGALHRGSSGGGRAAAAAAAREGLDGGIADALAMLPDFGFGAGAAGGGTRGRAHPSKLQHARLS